jgi:hypothetical protein
VTIHRDHIRPIAVGGSALRMVATGPSISYRTSPRTLPQRRGKGPKVSGQSTRPREAYPRISGCHRGDSFQSVNHGETCQVRITFGRHPGPVTAAIRPTFRSSQWGCFQSLVGHVKDFGDRDWSSCSGVQRVRLLVLSIPSSGRSSLEGDRGLAERELLLLSIPSSGRSSLEGRNPCGRRRGLFLSIPPSGRSSLEVRRLQVQTDESPFNPVIGSIFIGGGRMSRLRVLPYPFNPVIGSIFIGGSTPRLPAPWQRSFNPVIGSIFIGGELARRAESGAANMNFQSRHRVDLHWRVHTDGVNDCLDSFNPVIGSIFIGGPHARRVHPQ